MSPRSIHIGDDPTPYEGDAPTRVFAVLGHPVRHSLSPVFQNAALRALNVDAAYVTIDVTPESLPASVERMRDAAGAGVLAGVNVTVPHKTAIVPLLDRLDTQAAALGAVNTICFVGDDVPVQLEGRNTDVDGLLAALHDEGASMQAVPVIVLGAGGAARAAVWAALRAGASEVCVVSRNVERGRALLDDVATHWSKAPPAFSVSDFERLPAARLRRSGVLIQATSVGLNAGDPSLIDFAGASKDLFVLELVYHHETALLRAARAAGLRAAGGLRMLVHQGAASLRAWTRLEPPVATMLQSLENDA